MITSKKKFLSCFSFDYKSKRIFPIGIFDVDCIILQYVDIKTLHNLLINKYVLSILETQNFWKFRLYRQLGLTYNNHNLDYKFVTKFLENGKSLNKNYLIASRKNYSEVLDLLRYNNKTVMLNFHLVPKPIDFYILKTFSSHPYDEFISAVICNLDYEFDEDFFDTLAYNGRFGMVKFDIEVKTGKIPLTFHSDIPFTIGALLHSMAKKLTMLHCVGESKVLKRFYISGQKLGIVS